MSDATVRPYGQADADALWECKQAFELGLGTGTGDDEKAAAYREKLDGDYRASYFAWVDRCVAADERTVQLAERGDEVVGYVFVLPESMAHVWDAAVLNELYVAPDHRGTGVADALLDAALSAAREQSLPLDRLVLDVDPDNERARAFYDRWGFEPWGEMVARSL
ncbi:GNAT family N-acetyltransferase [Haloarcula marina]|uniref:GNAT family N-acetyltransferase n=1 Tax=Haloarcula marina TaxID=2961574 RepID=UPI0020B8FD90|nr:GNAT family N-acetyltransferase [Halomicroarcula marina]